jgi:Domain of unknown function (DUF1844)
MAEVQRQSVNAGEMAQRFVQFVVMQSQQILYVLGAPTPEGDAVAPNLEAAKIFIDQLEMIQEKTRGNLSSQEGRILEEALTRVRLAFVQISGGTPHTMMPSRSPQMPTPDFDAEPPRPSASSPEAASPAKTPPAPPEEETENKKRFVKSYG